MKLVNNYADMALISFMKILFKVRSSESINQFTNLPQVKEKIPGNGI